MNGFTDNHLLRRTYKVTDKEHVTQNETDCKQLSNTFKSWIQCGLKLNPHRTEYIQFASTKHIEKLDTLPFNANGDLIELSIVVRYDAATNLLLMLCISHLDYANAMIYNIPEEINQIPNYSEHLC